MDIRLEVMALRHNIKELRDELRLKTMEEKSFRNTSVLESQSSLNKFSFKTESHSHTKSMRDEFLGERNKLLIDITHNLASFWTPSTSRLDENVVLKGVKDTVEMLK